MRVTIDVREDWVFDVAQEVGPEGSNDAEHDLLMEIYEPVKRRVLERLKGMSPGAEEVA